MTYQLDKSNLSELALKATHALLHQQPLVIEHAAGWKRLGLPLPIKKMNPNADGVTTQQYRPLAILEYVEDVLSGEQAKRRINLRIATKAAKAKL